MKDDKADINFVYGCLIYDDSGNPRILTDIKKGLFTTCLKGTEGQYTGLKDKNDKEIYEGDIVSVIDGIDKDFTPMVCDVNYGGGEWEQSYTLKNKRFWKGYALLNYRHYVQFKVIGNIIETPSLLTEKK